MHSKQLQKSTDYSENQSRLNHGTFHEHGRSRDKPTSEQEPKPQQRCGAFLAYAQQTWEQDTPSEMLSPSPQTFHKDATYLVAEFMKWSCVLQTTFAKSNDGDFRLVVRGMPCVLNSVQPLTRLELIDAVHRQAIVADATLNSPATANKNWLHTCEAITGEDEAGLIAFKSPAMPYFLRQFRIRGVDTSHTMIGRACRHEIAQDHSRPQERSSSWQPTKQPSAFSSYVAQNWHFHNQFTTESRLDSAAASHRQFDQPSTPRASIDRPASENPPESLAGNHDDNDTHVGESDQWMFV